MPSPFYKNDEKVIVYLNYDKSIAKLTGKNTEVFALQQGSSSEELLAHFFNSYPSVFKKAIPGTLIYSINGAQNPVMHTLQTGDSVSFKLISLTRLRQNLLQELESLISLLEVSFSVKELLEFIEKEDSDNPEKMFKNFLNKEDEKKEAIALLEDVMFKVWNSFPRKSLNGKSFSQFVHEDLMKELFEIQKNDNLKIKTKK